MEKYRFQQMVKELPKKEIIDVLKNKNFAEIAEIKELLEILGDDSVKIIKTLDHLSNVAPKQRYGMPSAIERKYPKIKRKKDYLSVKEVARLFHVTEAAVYKWIKERKIEYIEPPIQGGRGILIPMKQFEGKLLNRHQAAINHKKFILKRNATNIDLIDRHDLFRS